MKEIKSDVFNNKVYYCEKCKITYELDEYDGIIHCYKVGNGKEEEITTPFVKWKEIGIISANPEDYEFIKKGKSCPVCDEWEDGSGHSCKADGWGE